MAENTFIDDISALDNLDFEVEQPSESEPYAAPKAGGGRTPKAGRFNLQLPTEIKVGAWTGEDGKTSLELQLDPVKVVNPGGEGDGLEIRFAKVSTRRIGGENASSATDLLQRAGMAFPRTPVEWQAAATELAGQTIEGVYCDWEARTPKDFDGGKEELKALRKFLQTKGIKVTHEKAGKTLIRGMRNFPKDKDGEPLSKLVYEDAPGGPLTLYANLKPTLRGFGLTEEEKAQANA